MTHTTHHDHCPCVDGGTPTIGADPLAHIRPGDLEPANMHDPCCGHYIVDYRCTRTEGHPGQHIAGNGGHVLAVAPAGHQPADSARDGDGQEKAVRDYFRVRIARAIHDQHCGCDDWEPGDDEGGPQYDELLWQQRDLRHRALCDVFKLDPDTDPYEAINVAEKVRSELEEIRSELADMTAQRDRAQEFANAVALCVQITPREYRWQCLKDGWWTHGHTDQESGRAELVEHLANTDHNALAWKWERDELLGEKREMRERAESAEKERDEAERQRQSTLGCLTNALRDGDHHCQRADAAEKERDDLREKLDQAHIIPADARTRFGEYMQHALVQAQRDVWRRFKQVLYMFPAADTATRGEPDEDDEAGCTRECSEMHTFEPPCEQAVPGPKDIDPRLLWALRGLGDDFGPLGVALAAAELTDKGLLRKQLSPGDEPITEPESSPWLPSIGERVEWGDLDAYPQIVRGTVYGVPGPKDRGLYLISPSDGSTHAVTVDKLRPAGGEQ